MNPPLPEPPAATLSDPDGQTLALFTESQLLAYRAEVIEMCAQKCEWHALNGAVTWREPRQDCADAIRNLK